MMSFLKDAAGQMQALQKLMQNEDFRKFISHPKVQELFQDPEFKELAKSRNFFRIAAHPRFAALAKDPELGALMTRLNPQKILQS